MMPPMIFVSFGRIAWHTMPMEVTFTIWHRYEITLCGLCLSPFYIFFLPLPDIITMINAQTMAKKFEEKFEKLCSQYDLGEYAGEGGHVDEPTIEEKRSFAKNLYKISKEELGKVIIDLETKCPKALTKNVAEDEVEINVDNISAVMFKEVVSYVNDCIAGGGSASSAKGKKVTTATKRKSKGQ